MVPISNGSGAYGETLSTPFVANPKEGNTVTFLSVGSFKSEGDAKRCLVYLKTKFFRALLGALKITQHNPASVWSLIPNQNYTNNSDISWNLPIKDIDKQLYKKYGLSNKEIEFIETHVKEME